MFHLHDRGTWNILPRHADLRQDPLELAQPRPQVPAGPAARRRAHQVAVAPPAGREATLQVLSLNNLFFKSLFFFFLLFFSRRNGSDKKRKNGSCVFLRLVGGCRNVEEEENVWGRFFWCRASFRLLKCSSLGFLPALLFFVSQCIYFHLIAEFTVIDAVSDVETNVALPST